MNGRTVLLSLVLTVSAAAALAQEESEEKEKPTSTQPVASKYNEGKIFKSNKNLQLPETVIQQIEKDFVEAFRASDGVRTKALKDPELVAKMKRKVLEVSVLFRNFDQMFEKPIFFNLNQGGGVIDLDDYFLEKAPGKFSLRMIAKMPEGIEDLAVFQKGFKVLFASNSKYAPGDQEGLGQHCKKFLDLTSYFKTTIMNEKGIIVSTLDNQHAMALSGSFIIYYPQSEDMFMSVVSFANRQQPNLSCRNI